MLSTTAWFIGLTGITAFLYGDYGLQASERGVLEQPFMLEISVRLRSYWHDDHLQHLWLPQFKVGKLIA